ncbi:catalase, partial [Bacillus pumilus]|uniref:catalase n=1 Tax=Bacillus pumilus TaxID=1408 RepID=UPI0011A9B734
PANYPQIPPSRLHTFTSLNKYAQTKYLKYHSTPSQPIPNLSIQQPPQIQPNHFHHPTTHLYHPIQNPNYPPSDLYLHFIPLTHYHHLHYHPSHPTNTSSQQHYPLQKLPPITLNPNPHN